MTLSSIFEEFSVSWINFNGVVKLLDGVIKPVHHVVTLSKAIKYGRIFRAFVKFISLVEVFNGLTNLSRFELRNTEMESRKRVVWIYTNCFFKVLNSELVVAHILVDEATLDVDCFISG